MSKLKRESKKDVLKNLEMHLAKFSGLISNNPEIIEKTYTVAELKKLTKTFEKVNKKAPSPKTAKKQELGLTQAENKLREIIEGVKYSPAFPRIANKKLGEFWDISEDRAPFEEAFTIKQLADFDLNMLLKKRTMNANKLCLMIQALENALIGTSVA